MPDESLGCPENIIDADAETNLLDDPVRVLRIDVVLYGYHAVALELSGCDLHQIRNLCLCIRLAILNTRRSRDHKA